MREYQERTGRKWHAFWPRESVKLFMWPCEFVGQRHVVELAADSQKSLCDGPDIDCLSTNATLELVCISQRPRAFRVENALSSFEADSVIERAKPHMHASTVGNSVDARRSLTRTSDSFWLGRHDGPVAERLYKRAAAVVGLPQELLVPRLNQLSMNILHYEVNEEYKVSGVFLVLFCSFSLPLLTLTLKPHLDWGSSNDANSRWATICWYLSTPEAGGGTGFPRAGLVNPAGVCGREGRVGCALCASYSTPASILDPSLIPP